MVQEATFPAELFEENIVPSAPFLGYLLRLGTLLRHGLRVSSSVSPLAQVIFCGFFFPFGSDWISTVQKQAKFTFTGVTEH